jgi:cardiolipin synthase
VRRAASWLNIPNLLSLARLALTPLAARSILQHDYEQALGVFAAAGVTDALDGLFARRFRWQTRLGAYLDPIVDKVLLVAVFVAMGIAELVPRWLVLLVLGRDLLILGFSAAIILSTSHRDFRPSVWGKISTILQITTVVAVIAGGVFAFSLVRQAASGLLWMTAAATVWSGIHYGWLGVRMVRKT